MNEASEQRTPEPPAPVDPLAFGSIPPGPIGSDPAIPPVAPPSPEPALPSRSTERSLVEPPPALAYLPASPLIPPPILPERAAPRRTWKQHVWAVLCHLMLFLVIPTVFLGAVITFFLWQIKGRRDPQVEDQGREALNFQINVAVLTALLGITFFGVTLVPVVWFVAGIFCVIAARKAAEGANYRYPYIWRVVTH